MIKSAYLILQNYQFELSYIVLITELMIHVFKNPKVIGSFPKYKSQSLVIFKNEAIKIVVLHSIRV